MHKHLEFRSKRRKTQAEGAQTPRNGLTGVNGTIIAKLMMLGGIVVRYLLGFLLQKGTRLVLMIRTTSVCERGDSIGQAVWNKGSFVQALRINSIVKEVA